MKRVFAFLILCLIFACIALPARAGLILGSPLFVNVATNSAMITTNTVLVTLPAFSVTISGITNGATIITNAVSSTLTVNGTALTIVQSFIYNANGSTADFTTNFPPSQITVPVRSLFQTIPQTTGLNNYFISVGN